MSEESAPQRLLNVENFMKIFKDSPQGAPYTLTHANPDAKDASIMRFDRHFNPDLARDSYYFKSLNEFMSCVEKHSGKELTDAQMDSVCATEFKKLRLRAFENQLMYHNVNKKFFMKELALFKNESPY
jgi:hypothetical protein